MSKEAGFSIKELINESMEANMIVEQQKLTPNFKPITEDKKIEFLRFYTNSILGEVLDHPLREVFEGDKDDFDIMADNYENTKDLQILFDKKDDKYFVLIVDLTFFVKKNKEEGCMSFPSVFMADENFENFVEITIQ